MSTITVSKSKFKPKAFEYLRRVEERKDTVCITDHGRPVAEITPAGKASWKALHALRGLVKSYRKPIAPVDELWDAER